MLKGWLFFWIWGFLSALGACVRLDTSLDHEDTGFFLKPLFHGQDLFSLNLEERHFVVTRPRGPVSVKAHYGSFNVDQNVSPELLQQAVGNHSNFLNNVAIRDLDISAHVVSRTITQERPLLQVLFHASHYTTGQPTPDKLEPAAGATVAGEASSSNPKWCLQMHVEKGEEELTSVCVLNTKSDSEVCIAGITLPNEWWDLKQTESADVYYSVYQVDEQLQCSRTSNSILPGRTEQEARPKSFISAVTLTHGQLTYQELKQDQHVLVYIPQKSFYAGSKFRVPVKLQAESDLQLFVANVRVRHGLQVVGAEARNPKKWHIAVDINPRQHRGVVTAYVNSDDESYSKTDRVQDIFDWIFEVEGDASGEDPGRLALSVRYGMDASTPEEQLSGTGGIENKLVARIELQRDNTYQIVPVIKTTEMVNTAILTGKTESYPMFIYSVSQAGVISDITQQTTCHSGDHDVLKVAESCDLVYLDGTEGKGASSVSVIAKYGRHTEFLFFRVWVPEIPLNIEVSDAKLSQVKNWRVPRRQRRKARGVEFGVLTSPDLLQQGEPPIKTTEPAACHLRFQSSVVEVYARFVVTDDLGKPVQYLVHRKAQVRVTEHVEGMLRVADTSVASLDGQVVEGLQPGRTEIQAVSSSGRVMGAHEIRVGNDKVTMTDLEVDVVTGLSMDLSSEAEFPGMLAARFTRHSLLLRKHQEGVLDVNLKFSDDTTLPLEYFPADDYFLDMDTLNNHVIAFMHMLSADMPRVVALGEGKGELLKLALELGDQCQRKKSRPLAISYVYVDVDFSKDAGDLQNDAGHYGYNQPSDRHLDHSHRNLHLGKDGKSKQAEEAMKVKPHQPNEAEDRIQKVDGIPISDLGQLVPGGMPGPQPSHEAHQQTIVEIQGLTPLEIGMYVLLGVFCLAIVVFMVNCMVFVVRYRRKHKPADVGGFVPYSQARDWVWIGRATLERNAINTTCSQALMPESDFNGNQPQLLQPPVSDPPSNRSSGCSQTSNRNSMVSTYKGSECSIRITANPMSDANANPTLPPPPLPEGIMAPPPPPPARGVDSPRPSTSYQYAASRTLPRELEGATGGAISDVEWDYEAMGMTYDQLMEYFDNLKESTA